MNFSKQIGKTERINKSRARNGARGIWQRRFWEHKIRDDEDERRHINYIHFNPVKHNLVNDPFEWKYSSIHRYYKKSEWKYNNEEIEQFSAIAKIIGD